MHKEMGAAGTEKLEVQPYSAHTAANLFSLQTSVIPVSEAASSPGSGVYSTMENHIKSWEQAHCVEQLLGMRAQSGIKEENRIEGSLPMRSWARAGRVLSVAGKLVEYRVMG